LEEANLREAGVMIGNERKESARGDKKLDG